MDAIAAEGLCMMHHTSTRLRILSFLTAMLVCIGALFSAMTAQAEVARLINIQPVVLPGNQVQVRFDFTLPPPLPQSYRVEEPASLVLDFWGVENDTAHKAFTAKAGPLRNIELGQGGGRLRATVNLNQPLPYRLYGDGNSIFLEIAPRLPTGLGPTEPPLRKIAADKPPMAAPTQLLGMEFDQDNEMGRVTLTLSDDQAGVDILEEGNNVLVNLLGARLSGALETRLELQHFGTPLMFLDAFNNDGNASVLVKPSAEPYRFSAYQMGPRLVLEFHPLQMVASADPSITVGGRYDGVPMTVSLQRVDVRAVLQMIAETAGQKLVVSETVRGEVSLRLLNMPWRDALALVLKTQQLEQRTLGDVMLILSQQDVAALNAPAAPVVSGAAAAGIAEERAIVRVTGEGMAAPAEVMMARPKRKPISVRTEMMPVRHNRASVLRDQLVQAGLMSAQGKIQADDAANMLVVQDTDPVRAQIRDVLSKLDVIVYKSLDLQAQLVVAPAGLAQRLGIRWSQVAPQENGLEVGFRPGDGRLPGLLRYLEQQGQLKIISQTQKHLQSGDEVSLERSRELTPLVGRESSSYQDVVMSLDVMSRIQQGGRILMDVNIARDVLSQIEGAGEMSIENNELISSVVVPDGDALVLTGFFDRLRAGAKMPSDQVSADSSLGNLPANTENSGQEMELLIFITPILAGSP